MAIKLVLLKKIVGQIKEDADNQDNTAIEDLLKDVPIKKIIRCLSEEKLNA